MKTYVLTDKPVEVHGLPFFNETGILERLPQKTRDAVPSLSFLGRRCPGARICFRTNSKTITLKMTLETLSPDIAMSIFSCQSAEITIGERTNARFIGLLGPSNYNEKIAEKSFYKNGEMEDVTIWFPRNEVIADFTISIEDGARIEAPTPYKYPPMLYYGSSITEGGGCCRLTNAYNAIISRHLDVDYYNFGFSGNAKGELPLADLIADIPMSIFVFDYDHNAPDPEHLLKTHEPFFKKIREKNPNLPVIMMTRPDFDSYEDSAERRGIVRRTYENAKAAGDENVWFLDGETFFGDTERSACTCDGCHPNDFGFYRMAAVVEPLVKAILEKKYNH